MHSDGESYGAPNSSPKDYIHMIKIHHHKELHSKRNTISLAHQVP
jgi:hypothetical protein